MQKEILEEANSGEQFGESDDQMPEGRRSILCAANNVANKTVNSNLTQAVSPKPLRWPTMDLSEMDWNVDENNNTPANKVSV